MTPQSNFMILARVAAQRESALRALLATMNGAPGTADPQNALVPFGRFDRLHFARFVVLDDATSDDLRLYGLTPPAYPRYLAFLGDVDGDAGSFIDELAANAAAGLTAIFSHCEGFSDGVDLGAWMRANARAPAANYVNTVGRTVRATRENAALHDALVDYADGQLGLADATPLDVHRRLRAFALGEAAAGRLTLTPDPPTPMEWSIRNVVHAIGVPLIVLILAIPLVLVGIVFWVRIRMLEATDPVYCPRAPAEHVAQLASLEDHGLTNQFSAMGSFKPGLVRRWTALFLLWLVDWAARHIYARGHLARVQTIHFARWVYLDDAHRLLFASNYDGSLDSYMDDFINKVAFGLNLVFSNGVAYPKTTDLIVGGAKYEQQFKNFIRRHQLPTEVWYNAHPGLTAVNLVRNEQIRSGIEQAAPSEREAAAWVALL
jgi:hypothetical protein